MGVLRTTAAAAAAAFLSIGAASAQESGRVADGGFFGQSMSACETDLVYLNQITGWQAVWPREWAEVAEDPAARADAVARWSNAPAALAAAEAALRDGMGSERAAPRAVVERIAQQTHDLADALADPDGVYVAADDEAGWNRFVAETLAPAVAAYADFLEDEYGPAAPDAPGLGRTPGGADCFESLVVRWTTLSVSRDALVATGERLLDEARAELEATAAPGESAADVLARLRAFQETNDTTQDELRAVSEAALARAADRVSEAFRLDTVEPIAVVDMEAHVQASAPAGYYRGAEDGRPAVYVINPSSPNERRLMAEVIAFHEGVPGHHLFMTYPHESGAGFNAGFAEGWALYAEDVADELGLYSTTLDRQGKSAKHLWAASRLVVEPGLHLDGWSRDQAIDFMLANTLLSRREIEIEVDRYIAMPGQSLSYMLGADLLHAERARAQAALGDAFDLREFHDVVLSGGMRDLPTVRDDIRIWVDSKLNPPG